MFADHPYARRLRGTPETIAAVGADDLRGFVRDRFAKDVLLIGVVGDITPDAAEGAARSDLRRPAGPCRGRRRRRRSRSRTEGELLLARLAIPQSVVVFGEPGIKRDDPDWYAAFIDNDILGGGGFYLAPHRRGAREARPGLFGL